MDEGIRHRFLASLTETEAFDLLHDWEFWARPAQLPPRGEWQTWLIMAGRGFGKTRTGVEWVRDLIMRQGARRVAIVGATAADCRDILIEGPSGILNISTHRDRPKYEPSKRRLMWPNGGVAYIYSAEEPNRLRGPQHDAALCDELCHWKYARETWDNLMFGLRIGPNPRVCVATTPRRIDLIREIIDSPSTVRTGGSTYENRSNLAPQFFDRVVSTYEGTRIGLQEIHAELSEITEGAWFPGFSTARHVTEAAGYIPGLSTHLAIDCGTSFHTGAVFFQVLTRDDGRRMVSVFGDYYAEGNYSRANAEAIRDMGLALCGGRLDTVRLDPASGHRTGIGPVVSGEYERVFGRRLVGPWPLHPVTDGLDLIEILLGTADRPAEIRIHPRCTNLIEAFRDYRRRERQGEWLDEPVDPQHPHEDLMDALRGGLVDRFPAGLRPDQSSYAAMRPTRFFK